MGTPLPAAPPERLVATGLYRYVRNPMYVAVVSIILGQALLFGNLTLLGYCFVVWLLFHIFVLAYEKPNLRARFGKGYKCFYANVPRWIPRFAPWRGEQATSSGLLDPDSTGPRRR